MTKIKFLFFLALGIFIFHWVYKFFAGPESIKLILNAKYKIFYLVIAHIPTLYFDSLAWIMLMMKKAKRNKLERKLDEYNHTMELIRTIVPIAVLALQIYILVKLI